MLIEDMLPRTWDKHKEREPVLPVWANCLPIFLKHSYEIFIL